MTRTHRRLAPAIIMATAMLFALVPTAQAAPADAGCDNRNINDQVQKLLACTDADDAFEHLEAFQAIADTNGDTRASGTSGYDQSVDYVVEQLEAAGWTAETQSFDFQYVDEDFFLDALATDGIDYPGFPQVFRNFFITEGDVTGPIEAVDVNVDTIAGQPADTSTSGCESSDFDDFTEGSIALIQRGSCAFSLKILNAQAAGAIGVVVFNEGNEPAREPIFGIGGVPTGITIPSLSASFAVGAELVDAEGDFRLLVEYESEVRSTENVIAELPGANDDNVVMAGAHLDSVLAGPGIQDNGSGSAALIAIAQELGDNRKFTPENTLRFAWWGAEESGLLGSNYYVANLDVDERDRIAAYLNFDMVASPNYFFGVYDADESSFAAPVTVPDGSVALEDLFEEYFTSTGTPYDDSEFSGRSDYQAFINVGIPSSGLFTGAEVLKTEEQAAIWGGLAGEQFDQCYHLACDTIDNVSMVALDANIDAIAYSVFSLALDTSEVNGVEGRAVKGDYDGQLAGPEFTFVDSDGGGGLDHTHEHAPTASTS